MRLASDIGGTFTDLVYLDERTGGLGSAKADTTPSEFERGVINTIHKAGIDVRAVDFFVHGTTVIINALTERKGVRTGLITTKGFRDVLEIGRANRPDLYNLAYTKPIPFVARALRMEVTERVTYKGEVLVPLAEDELLAAATRLMDEQVEAIAVCFLHAYANPTHEARAARLIRQRWPNVAVTASHELTREWREYERTSTAVLNSYVKPIAGRYLDRLDRELTRISVGGARYVMQSSGGTATFAAAREAPINMVESGPVAGVLGAVAIGKLVGESNLISLDIGGTTAKTSLVERGEVKVTTEYKIEWTRTSAGYPIKAPVVDIVEIGAGGGSVAWIDEAGSLHVGPQSAGAVPGPACYGRGGREPTLTDANVVAGRINPGYFLGGEIALDANLARDALQPVARHFGISVEEAALGVIRLANANMVNALKLVSVHRGYDPRDFTLVAFGGGGAMHATALAAELRIARVLIPANPAVFSAWGMLMTDLRYDLIWTSILRTAAAAHNGLDPMWDTLERQARDYYTQQGVAKSRLVFQRFADMRYAGQEHTVKVPVPAGAMTPSAIGEVERRFHALHEQHYTFRLPSPVEFVNFHLTAFGTVDKPRLPRLRGKGTARDALKGRREVDFDVRGRLMATVYERGRLRPGAQVKGPAIIEEPAATTVVFPGQHASVDAYGNLIIAMKA
ncbi:MAG: hydantoinase/oxoprolinase family protein [Bacillati bacterium ANGP1]|uniref:Hydantoinase/oxoprolinase family protein n=1 Tax=Candidatus Segetimicrobium genomatis TaxID=2569760 RepID=A0A537LBE1_9BACT|nr:MAG: hydantoinase/oxoprolinase family protein [Terrabacteria group bacterium ANGP1]